jgi:hypothetical protein
VTYGDGVARIIRDAADGRLDASTDTFGSGYVDVTIDLGVPLWPVPPSSGCTR